MRCTRGAPSAHCTERRSCSTHSGADTADGWCLFRLTHNLQLFRVSFRRELASFLLGESVPWGRRLPVDSRLKEPSMGGAGCGAMALRCRAPFCSRFICITWSVTEPRSRWDTSSGATLEVSGPGQDDTHSSPACAALRECRARPRWALAVLPHMTPDSGSRQSPGAPRQPPPH